MGHPRGRPPAARDLRLEHLLPRTADTGVFREPSRQHHLRGAGAMGRRQSATGHERRRAAVGGPVRAGRVSAGASRRHAARRCHPGRRHLRVLAGAAVPDQPAAPHHDSVGAVHARLPAQVSRQQEPERPEAGDRVLHAAGADLGPRRSVRDRQRRRADRLSPRLTRANRPAAARQGRRSHRTPAAGAMRADRRALSPRAGRDGPEAAAHQLGNRAGELPGLADAPARVARVAVHRHEAGRRCQRVPLSRNRPPAARRHWFDRWHADGRSEPVRQSSTV